MFILTPATCPVLEPSDECLDELLDGGARTWAMTFDLEDLSRSTYPSSVYYDFARPMPTVWTPAAAPDIDTETPGAGWTYLLFSERGECLYVGMTTQNFGNRFSHHVDEARRGVLMKHTWIPGVHHAVILFSKDPGALERRLIVQFSPSHIREFRSTRSSDTPSTLTDVLNFLENEQHTPLRVDQKTPTRKTPVLGPAMSREERVAAARIIRENRLAHYADWAQQPRKIEGPGPLKIEYADGSSVMIPRELATPAQLMTELDDVWATA